MMKTAAMITGLGLVGLLGCAGTNSSNTAMQNPFASPAQHQSVEVGKAYVPETVGMVVDTLACVLVRDSQGKYVLYPVDEYVFREKFSREDARERVSRPPVPYEPNGGILSKFGIHTLPPYED